MAKLKVAVLVGSLRKGSYTRKVAAALMALAPDSLDCAFVEFGDLPLYSEDLDGDPPAAWTRFREAIKACNAVLIATPEYNRSIPGGLKNAMDIGSRPQGQSVWDGLPTAVVSVSPYKTGGFGANHHLRQTMVFLNMPAMQQPEAYIGGAAEMFDESGAVKSPDTKAFLTRVIDGFARWAHILARGASDQGSPKAGGKAA